MSHSPLLEVDDLEVHFRTGGKVLRAVDGVSFTVREGETLGIVGESGSGKSVTVSSILRLVPTPPGRYAGGRILYRGDDLLKVTDRRMRQLRGNEISMIFQDPMTSLNPYLKISRQLTEVLELHQGMTRKAARVAGIEMLERVGLPDAPRRFDAYPHQFSGGMRQRVMVAMALLCRPKLLIADEPTTALDVTIQAQILELIKDLRHRHGTAVIMITHDLGVVAGMADRLLVMYAGRLAEEADATSLFGKPGHPYTHGLLRSVPRLDKPGIGRLESIPGMPPVVTDLPPGCPFRPRCTVAVDACSREFPPRAQLGPTQYAYCHQPLHREVEQ